jgi:GNAT superfamily N-acetyltransferase
MERISFSVTSFEEYQEEILRIRNNNRHWQQTLGYMRWRYRGEVSPYPPVIFWVRLPDGTSVGMAAIIFRPYWVNNKLHYFAVLGDISVDEKMRGKGVGRKFLQFINSYIEKESYFCSLVIPNNAVRKSLEKSGWIVAETFVWYVLFVNPASRIYNLLKSRVLAEVLNSFYHTIMSMRLSRISIDNYKLEKANTFDKSFDLLWQAYPKWGIILRDRSSVSLRWRYEKHPDRNYEIIKFLYEEKFVGYIIYEIGSEGKCFIEDILIFEAASIKPIMKLFISEMWKNKNVRVIRVKLNVNHSYADELEKTGFIKRMGGDIIQTFTPQAISPVDCKWFLNRGDKDT